VNCRLTGEGELPAHSHQRTPQFAEGQILAGGLFTAVVIPQCALRVSELYLRMQIAARGIQAQSSVISPSLSFVSLLRIMFTQRRTSHPQPLQPILDRTQQWGYVQARQLSEQR